jgi:hypothetical protein
MGVSLNYKCGQIIDKNLHQQLSDFANERNKLIDWWCESIWITEPHQTDEPVFGSTKLFCNIQNEEVDAYMAYLDIIEIIKFLEDSSKKFSLTWTLEIEGGHFGEISSTGPDSILKENLELFLQMFPNDFTSLKNRTRESILKEWADR